MKNDDNDDIRVTYDSCLLDSALFEMRLRGENPWGPSAYKLKYIPAPPKPPDFDAEDWKLLHDMINEGGILDDGD